MEAEEGAEGDHKQMQTQQSKKNHYNTFYQQVRIPFTIRLVVTI